MKKLFIDIGGHLGQSIERFYTNVSNAKSWDIVSFEPLVHKELSVNIKKYDNVEVIPKAAWVKDINIPLYVDSHMEGIGSTVLKGKLSGKLDYQHPKMVQAVNFPEWFRRKQESYDYIVIKMNIEGSEYILLPYFLNSGLLEYINELYVETHCHKFGLPLKESFKQIEDFFIKRAVNFKTKLYFYTNNILYFQCRIHCREQL